jgi:hypothetical protein
VDPRCHPYWQIVRLKSRQTIYPLLRDNGTLPGKVISLAAPGWIRLFVGTVCTFHRLSAPINTEYLFPSKLSSLLLF